MTTPSSLSPTRYPNQGWARCTPQAGCTYPSAPPTPEELADACSSGEFDVAVAQLSDMFDADLLGHGETRRNLELRGRLRQYRRPSRNQQCNRRRQHPRSAHRRHRRSGDAAHSGHRTACHRSGPVHSLRTVHRMEAGSASRSRCLGCHAGARRVRPNRPGHGTPGRGVRHVGHLLLAPARGTTRRRR